MLDRQIKGVRGMADVLAERISSMALRLGRHRRRSPRPTVTRSWMLGRACGATTTSAALARPPRPHPTAYRPERSRDLSAA